MLTITDKEFIRVVDFVRDNYGINLIKKRALVQGRLALDVERRGFSSFGQYFNTVMSNPEGALCQHMIDKLSTNHTFFFREPACLEHMRDVAVPSLIARGVKHIDIWSAAASTGHECYSIAMMMQEALTFNRGVTYSILGSDINCEVLSYAKAGVYPIEEMQAIPQRFHKLYCRKTDNDSFEIAPVLKERIIWKKINLVRPLTFIGRQHLIFCRNVMIYFEPETKDALTTQLYNTVEDGGFVYVGNTETLDMKRTRFKYVSPSVFEKLKAAR